MIDAQTNQRIDQSQTGANGSALEALSAQARRECAHLGRLLARHASGSTATERAALDAEIAATAQTLADLNASLQSARSRQQTSGPARIHSAA